MDPPNTQKEIFELFKNEIVNICCNKGGKNDPDWNFEEGAIAYRIDK